MPDLIKIQNHQMNPFAQEVPAVDPQLAAAWWADLQAQALTARNGPARDLSSNADLAHLFIVNDAGENGLSLSAVNESPDPQQLYALAKEGRLLLTPTGMDGGTFQLQVNKDDPSKSAWCPVSERLLTQTLTDPRHGIGYWLMRAANALSLGNLFSERLAAMDREAEAAVAMTNTVKQSFLSKEDAAKEWEDPAHLNALQQAGYITRSAQPEVVNPTMTAQQNKNQRMMDLVDFADNVYVLFGNGEYPKTLSQTRVSQRPGEKTFEMDASMTDFSVDDMALMAFLAVADPSLEYYQSSHLANYNTLSGSLSGPELVNDRVSQLYDGMLGRRGALDAVYLPCNQAALKIQTLCENGANAGEFASHIVNGLNILQNTLKNSTTPDDRFLQSAALASHVSMLIHENRGLRNSLTRQGFQLDSDLFDRAANFYRMHSKAMRAEVEFRRNAEMFPNSVVPEEMLESGLPAIAESRFQQLYSSKNGLQSTLKLYSDFQTSDKISQKILDSDGFKAQNGCTYKQLAAQLNNNAGLVSLFNNAMKGPESKPQIEPEAPAHTISAPQAAPQPAPQVGGPPF